MRRPNCRWASSRFLVADQAVTVESAISEFMSSLWQAVGIILVGELHQPRRAGRALSSRSPFR